MSNSLPQRYTIYKLIDPRDGLPHYVGITDSPDRRLYEHINRHVQGVAHASWIQELVESGSSPAMEVIEEIHGLLKEAMAREKYWIQSFTSQGMPLVNKRNVYRLEEKEEGRQTVYLNPELRKWARHRAIDEDMTISDLILKAMQEYRARVERRK